MAERTSFAVPVAFSGEGTLVRPADAEAGTRYRCPGCSAELVLRRGGRRRPHFAHRGGDGCSAESALHRAAKHRILQVVGAWKDGTGPRPSVARPCPVRGCDGGVVQDLPDDVTHAVLETRLADGTVADVVLFRGSTPAAAIEVVVSHRVGRAKAARLSVPWMELRAGDVLERPYWWVAVQDGLQPFACPTCARAVERAERELREVRGRAARIAERLGVALAPSPPYRSVPHVCWRCGSEMVAFLWPGGGAHGATRPPDPIPATVRHRVTDGGDDWANCCPACSAVQGDYHLARDNGEYLRVRELSLELEHWADRSALTRRPGRPPRGPRAAAARGEKGDAS